MNKSTISIYAVSEHSTQVGRQLKAASHSHQNWSIHRLTTNMFKSRHYNTRFLLARWTTAVTSIDVNKKMNVYLVQTETFHMKQHNKQNCQCTCDLIVTLTVYMWLKRCIKWLTSSLFHTWICVIEQCSNDTSTLTQGFIYTPVENTASAYLVSYRVLPVK